jgi:FK506-binding nuclear protein
MRLNLEKFVAMSQLPVATWALELKPSEKTTYKLHNSTDLKITNAALGPVLQDENARSTVILHINNDPPESEDGSEDDEKDSEDAEVPPQRLVLTSLIPGKVCLYHKSILND